MSVFVVPELDEQPWPTLGPQVCDLIEERCIHGPGDLKGQPARIDDEKRAQIYAMYEVYPYGHPRAGRRRFKRCAVYQRKGTAKTELAAWVAYAELHPEGPVRCDGFHYEDGLWLPVGVPVTDPYIPMIAVTEDQTEELAYGALLAMCQEGPDSDLFDAGFENITRLSGDGKAEAVATAPDSADGKRTSFQHLDESHRLKSKRQKEAVQTMRNNLPKRVLADAWELESSTIYRKGAGSVAEDTHKYAIDVAAGKTKDKALFVYYRWAEPKKDENLDDIEQCKAAIREASGPSIAKWPHFEEQVESIAALRFQPDTDKDYWEQVWLNRAVSSASSAFNSATWAALRRPGFAVPRGKNEPIVAGFDGARWRDACAIVATHIETGYQWPIALWEKPAELTERRSETADAWEVTDEMVDGAFEEMFADYQVFWVYADPPRFEANLARYAGKYGPHRVVEWYTNRPRQIGQAMRAYRSAMDAGAVSHSGNPRMAAHLGHAQKGDLNILDDDGRTPLWTIYKSKPDSAEYIDLTMAGCLSWRARLDALIKGGWEKEIDEPMVVFRNRR